ncbi:MAG: autotransporter outer membrane beta-barrel domain-containing protein [Rhizobiaceae bacterium]|nr:autotransporter outer membrane beta-barrel domain-containing protein [Rhizobiaceae bacterium]
MNLNADVTTFLMGIGDDSVENRNGSIINANNNVIWTFDDLGPQGKDTFSNVNGSQYVGTGTSTFYFGGNDDEFLNDHSSFTQSGTALTLSFEDGDDEMTNDDWSFFSSTALLNTFLFGEGADNFLNDNGSTFLLQPDAVAGLNTFDFGDDFDTFVNDNGSEFHADGVNTFLNLENMRNDNGSSLKLHGVNTITGLTGADALVNAAGAYFEVEGVNTFTFSDDDDHFLNDGEATFHAQGATTFWFGNGTDDAVTNTGGATIATGGDLLAPSLMWFNGLERFNGDGGNTSMQDGEVWDAIVMYGTDYRVDGSADHYIDANLTGPFSWGADIMSVGRVSGDGTTYVHVNDVSAGPGEYNPFGVAIVNVENGNADINDFRMAGGPIQKGLFSYDIYLNDGNSDGHPKCGFSGDDCFVIASDQGQRSFELPVLAYGAQQLWHTSTGAWSDRTADLRSAFGGSGFGGGGADAVVETLEPAVSVANITPGIWGRVFGSTQSRDFSNTIAPPSGLVGFATTFDSNFDQDIYGVMAGVDFGRESVTDRGGQAWIFGLFGGYTGSNVTFDNSDTDVDYEAGSVGGYVTYLNGGLFVDATIKADFGTMDYSSGGDYGSADFTSVGGVVDTGYRFTTTSGFYVEPKATLAYVQTEFDNIEIFGTDVAFNDGDSLRGRLGARLGKPIDRNGMTIDPYVEASIWNEFDGDYSAAFFSNGTGFVPGFDAEGVYGEVAGGASFINTGNGWSGFARGAVQFGEDSALGLTGNLGVRKAW